MGACGALAPYLDEQNSDGLQIAVHGNGRRMGQERGPAWLKRRLTSFQFTSDHQSSM